VPLDKYFKGKGKKVMKNMKKEYGEKKGKSIFYATANKNKGMDTGPSDKVKKKHGMK
jgi:hypothetical protein